MGVACCVILMSVRNESQVMRPGDKKMVYALLIHSTFISFCYLQLIVFTFMENRDFPSNVKKKKKIGLQIHSAAAKLRPHLNQCYFGIIYIL